MPEPFWVIYLSRYFPKTRKAIVWELLLEMEIIGYWSKHYWRILLRFMLFISAHCQWNCWRLKGILSTDCCIAIGNKILAAHENTIQTYFFKQKQINSLASKSVESVMIIENLNFRLTLVLWVVFGLKSKCLLLRYSFSLIYI